MPSDACWACKDRKVRCDRIQPKCSRCSPTNRDCQYGLRLSWPKANDKKRALKSARYTHTKQPRSSGIIRLVNAGLWDIHVHQQLLNSSYAQGHFHPHKGILNPLAMPSLPMHLSPYSIDERQADLLEYFCANVFSSIGNFCHDNKRLHGLIHRLALTDSSLSSRAVLEASLALSSLHRHGYRSEATLLKLSALRTLRASSWSGLEASEGIQHVVAGMMLCYFEIQNIHDTTFQWMIYVCGSKNLMQALALRNQSFSSEFSAVLDWVDYHFVIGLFSFQHWRPPSRSGLRPRQHSDNYSVKHITCMVHRVVDLYDAPHPLLGLLYEVVTTIKRPSDPGYFSDDYAASLDRLESKIISSRQPPDNTMLTPTEANAYTVGMEMYRIATLIYLERVSRNFSGQSKEIVLLVERGFKVLEKLDMSSAALPLFIIGLEARTDEQRLFVLDLVERISVVSRLRSLETVSRLVQAAWVQDDLETEYDVDYVMKLDTIITSNKIIPTLA